MANFASRFSKRLSAAVLVFSGASLSIPASAQVGDPKNRAFDLLVSRNLDRVPLFIEEFAEATRWTQIASTGLSTLTVQEETSGALTDELENQQEAATSDDPLAPLWDAETVELASESNDASMAESTVQEPAQDLAQIIAEPEAPASLALVPLVSLAPAVAVDELATTGNVQEPQLASSDVQGSQSEPANNAEALGLTDAIAVVAEIQPEDQAGEPKTEAVSDLEALGIPMPTPLPVTSDPSNDSADEPEPELVSVETEEAKDPIEATELAEAIETIKALANMPTGTEDAPDTEIVETASLLAADPSLPPLPNTRPDDVPRYRKVTAPARTVSTSTSSGVNVITGSAAQEIYDSLRTNRTTSSTSTRSSNSAVIRNSSTFGSSVPFDSLTPEQQYDILQSQGSKL